MILLDCSLSAERDQYPQLWHGNCILCVSTSKIISVENLARSLRILLDIYGMERGSQSRNKTFRKPWSGHRITYSSSSTCCGLGILYPSWSKLTIFLPSIRGYGEPPKKEKVTGCDNTLQQGMSSPKICCRLCCCFYSKLKELTVAARTIYLHTRLFICLILAPEELQKAVNFSHGVSSCCNKVTVLTHYQRTFALYRETVVSLDVKHFN